MKKLIIATLAVLMVAGSAYALDGSQIDFTGSYYVRGSYFSNDDVSQKSGFDAYSNYDHELDLRIKFNISDTTFVYTRWEAADYTWPGPKTSSKDVTDDTGAEIGSVDVTSRDSDLEVQRAYGSHTFGTQTQLDLGLMTGDSWATAFGEASGGVTKIQVKQPTETAGTWIFYVQKNAEFGSDEKKSEEHDGDEYALGWVYKAGDHNILPFLRYRIDGSNTQGAGTADDPTFNGDTDSDIRFDLGVDGSFAGNFGYEAEFIYDSFNFKNTKDYSVWGLYGDLFYNFNAGKLGGYFAYGSVDKDTNQGFNFGDDFDGHGSELLGNTFGFGGEDAMWGATAFGIYGSYNATDALSFWAQISYAVLNDNMPNEKDSATDFSANMVYKITDAVKYKIGGGYASINKDEGTDPDPGYKLYHRFDIKF